MSRFISDNFNQHSLKIPSLTNGMKVWRLSSLTYVDSGLSCDTFNVIHITNGTNLSFDEINQAVTFYESNNLAFCLWISEENLTPKIADYFNRLSLKEQNSEPGMVLELDKYEVISNEMHRNIRVAGNVSDVMKFAEVIAVNWVPPDQNVISYYKQTAKSYLDPGNRIVLAVYYDDHVPVSTIEMFPSDSDTIGLYALSTLGSYRGKGIGTAVMTFALNKAKQSGYKRVILQASEDGIGIYSKLGFKVESVYFEYA